MNEIFYKLPRNFLEKLQLLYPNHYLQILNTFLVKKQTTFRINYLKTDLVNLKKELLKEGLRFHEFRFQRAHLSSRDPLRLCREPQRTGLARYMFRMFPACFRLLRFLRKTGKKSLICALLPAQKLLRWLLWHRKQKLLPLRKSM